jgi:hypothetical protein
VDDPETTNMRKTDEQVLVDNGLVSNSALDVIIEGSNQTLLEYYESIRPVEIGH